MKLNLDKVGSKTAMKPVENDNDELIRNFDINIKKARACNCTVRGNRLKGLKLNLDAFISLPCSYYMLTKDCPIVECLLRNRVNLKKDELLQKLLINEDAKVSHNTVPPLYYPRESQC